MQVELFTCTLDDLSMIPSETCHLQFNWKVPKAGTPLLVDGISRICHFQHLCQLPKNKSREEMRSALFWGKRFEKSLSSLLIVIQFEEYKSGERSKEMHVHIDDKEIEKILRYIKIRVGV